MLLIACNKFLTTPFLATNILWALYLSSKHTQSSLLTEFIYTRPEACIASCHNTLQIFKSFIRVYSRRKTQNEERKIKSLLYKIRVWNADDDQFMQNGRTSRSMQENFFNIFVNVFLYCNKCLVTVV